MMTLERVGSRSAAVIAATPRLVRFVFVGCAIACIQLAILSILTFWIDEHIANIIAIMVAVQGSFILGSLVTWGDRLASGGTTFVRWLAFHGSVAGTVSLNMATFALTNIWLTTLPAAAAGIGAAAAFNYLSGDRLVFRSAAASAFPATFRPSISVAGTLRPLATARWDLIAVGAGTALISALAYAYYKGAGYILISNDATSRLNIARRVFDSPDPGLVQLGGIWLPLPHMAMLPFVWIDPLWRSGLAGSIPSMAAFVAASLYLYALGSKLTGNRFGGLAACLVFLFNPNMLYLQAVPLSESIMVLTVVGAAYHMLVWMKQESVPHLVAAGLWVFLSTLTRYEGWALIIGGAIIVGAVTYWRHREFRRVQAYSITFLAPAAYGVALWMLYSLLIFGDAFHFSEGVGTTRFDTENAAAFVQLNTEGQMWGSLRTFGWAVIDMISLPTLALAGIGAIVLVVMTLRSKALERSIAPTLIALLSVPAVMLVFSLFSGTTLIMSANTPVEGLWNTRYGLQALPAIALLVALPAVLHRYVGVALVAVIIGFTVFSFQHGDSLTGRAQVLNIVEGDEGRVAALRADAWADDNFPFQSAAQPLVVLESLGNPASRAQTEEAARWLHDHYDGERILISAFANDPFIFEVDMSLDRFIFEGAQPYWDDELEHPGTWTNWVVFRKGNVRDLVATELEDTMMSSREFALAYENDFYMVFQKSTASTSGPKAKFVRGDANCDGTASAADAVVVLVFSAETSGSLPCPKNSDLNQDGAADTLDAFLILVLDEELRTSTTTGG